MTLGLSFLPRRGPASCDVQRLVGALLLCLALSAGAQDLGPISGVSQMAVGGNHTCVLTDAGGVKCWGSNSSGQLGDGTTANRYLPVNVVGLSSNVIAIAAGHEHSCAVTDSGGVKCWGRNLLGQLGDGTTTRRLTPVDVSDLTDIATVVAGSGHSCALGQNGDLHCWGFNADGQLGTGDRDNRTKPDNVVGGQGIAAVTAGFANTCAITGSGGVRCWGVYDRTCNNFGCAFASHAFPTSVSGLGSGVVAVSAGEYFNCAITADGTVKCWGDNYDGQLGNPEAPDPDPFELFDIGGLSAVVGISTGYGHACARQADATVRCWGDNASGRLGDGSNEYRFPAVAVAGLGPVAQIGAGSSHSCALTTAGEALCWGSGVSGQLGDNDPWFRLEPAVVPGLPSGVVAISAGEFHSCAVTAAGAVRCWGANSSGQIGDGTTDSRRSPATSSGLAGGATAISAGATHTCAVVSGGVRCWGDNERAQLGTGDTDDRLVPTPVLNLASGAADVAAGELHSCARTTGGAAKCWGLGIFGQLGDGSLSSKTSPVNVFGLTSGVAGITAGSIHACAIVSGTVRCWGDNGDGQIGDGTTDTAFTPSTLSLPASGTSSLSAGSSHSCAVASGQALCWGDRANGRLGIGGSSFGTQRSPSPVQGLASGTATISAGLRHSCAVTTGGAALCWGDNSSGQLGDGTTDGASMPGSVSGLSSGVAQISAGGFHSCALSTSGEVSCWGSNASHQLGIDRRDNRLPGPVLDNPAFFRSGFEAGEAPAAKAARMSRPH